MAVSTKLEKPPIDALNSRLVAIEARNLVDAGDNISTLNNDAGYQNASQVNATCDAKINSLIGAAPGTLNTLEEIAQALADDDSAIAALVSVDTQHGNDISTLQSENTTQANQLATLFLRTGVTRRTLSSDLTLAATDKRMQNCINPSATVRLVAFPASPSQDLDFLVINHSTSVGNITVNGNNLIPGQQYAAIFDGTEWVEY